MAIYRFSEYQFNTETRELKSGEESVRLRRKVAEVLALLIQQRERAVTKEELLDQVWEQGEFRENSLLQCVRELRKLLKDSAQSPQYIQTVHRLGYQWIFTAIEEVPLSQETLVSVSDTTVEEGSVPTDAVSSSKGQNVLNILAGLILMGIMLTVMSPWEKEPLSSETELLGAIAVLPFENNTADPSLQWVELGFADMFTQSLARVSGRPVVPIVKVQQALASIPKLELSNDSAAALINEKKLGAAIVVRVEKDQASFLIHYTILTNTGNKIVGELRYPQLDTSLNAMVLSVMEQLDLLGVPVSHRNNQLAMGMSDEGAALQAYASGIQAMRTLGAKLARHYFEAALIHDTDFVEAKIKLAQVLFRLGEWAKSEELYKLLLVSESVQNDRQLMAEVLFGLGDVCRELNSLEQAESYLSQALALAQEAKRIYLEADILRSMSQLYGQSGEQDKRHQLLLQADALSRPFQSPYLEAEALYYLGSPSNQGLEVDDNINMEANKERMVRALAYYQSVKNLPGEAMSLLAIGQNYLFDLPRRESALSEAEQKFRVLGNKAGLVDTLNYHAYFYIQLHLGDRALPLLDEAQLILASLPSKPRKDFVGLFKGLAFLDIGTDRGNGPVAKQLHNAESAFSSFIQSRSTDCQISMVADAHLLLAWSFIELGRIEEALPLIDFAAACYAEGDYPVSLRYANNTIMDVYIQQAKWQPVIDLAATTDADYLNIQYLARAHYELGQAEKAVALMKRSKREFSRYWQEDNEQKLQEYENAVGLNQQTLSWVNERSSRLVYCDDLWSHEGLEEVLNAPLSGQ